MLSEDHVGLGEALEEAVVDHRVCSLRYLFRWLEDSQQRSPPRVASQREERGGAHQPSHVHVVAAGVHHRYRFSVAIGGRDLARVGKAGSLLHRQRIHVGPQHDRRAVTVSQYTYDAGLPHSRGHVVSGRAQMIRCYASCPILLHGELGMRMDVLVKLL